MRTGTGHDRGRGLACCHPQSSLLIKLQAGNLRLDHTHVLPALPEDRAASAKLSSRSTACHLALSPSSCRTEKESDLEPS